MYKTDCLIHTDKAMHRSLWNIRNLLGGLSMYASSLSWYGWALMATYVATFSVMIACFCCDLDEGPFAAVATFLSTTVPRVLSRALYAVLGDRVASRIVGCLSGSLDWTCYRRNPLMQLFYLTIVLGAYGIIVVSGYPMLPMHYMATWHRYTAFIAVVFCLYTFYLACSVGPGIITAANLSTHAALYAPEKYMYPPGRVCATTKFLKPVGASLEHGCPPRA